MESDEKFGNEATERDRLRIVRGFKEGFQMTIAHHQIGPCIELEGSLPCELAAISPFVNRLMLSLRKCGCVPQGESDVEIELREALGSAIIRGNHENPRKCVYIRCHCEPDGVSITVKHEGKGFDISKMSDPTAPKISPPFMAVAST